MRRVSSWWSNVYESFAFFSVTALLPLALTWAAAMLYGGEWLGMILVELLSLPIAIGIALSLGMVVLYRLPNAGARRSLVFGPLAMAYVLYVPLFLYGHPRTWAEETALWLLTLVVLPSIIVGIANILPKWRRFFSIASSAVVLVMCWAIAYYAKLAF